MTFIAPAPLTAEYAISARQSCANSYYFNSKYRLSGSRPLVLGGADKTPASPP